MAKGTLRIRIVGDASNLEKTLGKATGSLGKFAKMGGLALGAAVVGGVTASIKAFADFDAKMTESVAIMGDVSDAMRKDMSDAAREVAKTTKFSATDAAESYFFLASAGMDAAQSIEALPKVAAFAQAGAFDMALATDLLTDSQSALGMVVDDTAKNLENLARVGDVLVGANTLANASVQQFSEALTEKAGNALRMLNKDVEEGVAVLAVYADAGVKGSAAGTQLSAVLEGLTRTARLNTEQYEQLGVSVFDSSGEMRNMADIVGDMEGALAGMSTEQRLAKLSSLGLTRTALDGTVALLGNADAIREYEGKLRDMGGIVDEVADKQMQTFWAQLGLVGDKIKDVALSVGEALMPAMMAFGDWLNNNLDGITGWFDQVSGKFMELMGISDESIGGAVEDLDKHMRTADSWERAIERHLTGAGEDLKAYNRTADAWEASQRKNLEAAGVDMENLRSGVDTETDKMAGFMQRLGDAWQTIWQEDIVPWFHNTLIPWLTDVAAPAIGAAGWKIGAALGKGLYDGLPGWLKKPGWADRMTAGLAEVTGGIASLGKGQIPTSNMPALPGGAYASLATGGIVRRRPGGIMANIGEGAHDEAVLPLNDRVLRMLGGSGGGDGGSHTTIVMLDGREIARSEVFLDELAQQSDRRTRLRARAAW